MLPVFLWSERLFALHLLLFPFRGTTRVLSCKSKNGHVDFTDWTPLLIHPHGGNQP